MRIKLEYGRGKLEVELPEKNVVRVLAYKDAEPLADPRTSLRQSMEGPIGARPLSELATGRKNACILICDITRPVPNQLILTEILATLQASGIVREDILILIATGLHRPNVGDELVEMVGAEIAENYRIENHFGQDLDAHTYLGESPNGVPIWIDSRFVDADLKISTGLIEPHFMAGFSGGRKLIFPGIAAIDSIKAWHSPRFLEHPNATTGVLKDNPVHFENTWIAKRVGCDFIVNVVIDDRRRPLKFVSGDMEAAFQAGVEFVRQVVADTIPEEVDIVVTSSAGFPLDATFYQSVKGMVGAMPVVKQGGTIVVAASLSEGIGSPEFQRIFDDFSDLDDFIEKISNGEYFQMDQWQVEELAKVCRKARIIVVSSGLAAGALNRMFVETAISVEQAVADALAEYGPDATIAVIPTGPYVMASVG